MNITYAIFDLILKTFNRVMDPSMCLPGQSLKYMFKEAFTGSYNLNDQNQDYYLQYKEATRSIFYQLLKNILN